jgi:hypothetical protein
LALIAELWAMIRFDGHYRSDVQKHIRFEDGVRREEEFYLYYTFFPEGVWICKTTHVPNYRMDQFLRSINTPAICSDPDADEPLLPNKELLYQSGTWKAEDNLLHIEWHNSNLEQSPMEWSLVVVNSHLLQTISAEYNLKFQAH